MLERSGWRTRRLDRKHAVVVIVRSSVPRPGGRMRRQRRRRIHDDDSSHRPGGIDRCRARTAAQQHQAAEAGARPVHRKPVAPSSTGQTIGLVNPATEQPFGRARNPSTTACSARFFVRAPRPTGQAERAGTATAHSSQLIFRKDLSRGSRRCRHHAGRRRWPVMLMGSTRMKCSGSPCTHDWRPTLLIDARSASVSA